MDLTQKLRTVAENNGTDYFGVADLVSAKDFIAEQGGKFASNFPYAISIGIIQPHYIIDLLAYRTERLVREAYHAHAYEIVNNRLNHIASILSSDLQKKGYKAFPIASTNEKVDERLCELFSHKLAAHLAGLGWIGKSCMIITSDNGPRVRWASVLTNAPLISTGSPMEDKCGDCSSCVDICPVSAFTGREFHVDEPRSDRFDAQKCQNQFKDMGLKNEIRVCGLCIYACPYGKQQF